MCDTTLVGNHSFNDHGDSTQAHRNLQSNIDSSQRVIIELHEHNLINVQNNSFAICMLERVEVQSRAMLLPVSKLVDEHAAGHERCGAVQHLRIELQKVVERLHCTNRKKTLGKKERVNVSVFKCF